MASMSSLCEQGKPIWLPCPVYVSKVSQYGFHVQLFDCQLEFVAYDDDVILFWMIISGDVSFDHYQENHILLALWKFLTMYP